jgi:HTH-type transcriptional repressor of NAD biosynthesis genes
MEKGIKTVCFFGPESTGKSVMARRMAAHYSTEYVPEVARELIVSNDFLIADIIRIGKAQTQRVLEKMEIANKILFCDTDLITTQIYSRVYLNEIPPVLYELEKQISYDLYFLFDIDVPWIPDGLRDLGHRRAEMFKLFKDALETRGIPFTLLSGSWMEKEATVIKEVNALLRLTK